MKISEFKRWLGKQGVVFKEGTRHTKLYYAVVKAPCPDIPIRN